MPVVQMFNTNGVNTFINPYLQNNGELITAINVDSFPYGAKTKRPGYETFLGTPDTNRVNSLFSWQKDDGTSLFLYRASGSALYYSAQGTGAWTLCGNGTITDGAHVGYAVFNNTLIIGDGAGSTRHTTNGTSFTNTNLAPVGEFFDVYQNRVYIAGTASDLFYSSANDGTNWETSGTSDSSSLKIGGAGKLGKIFVCADRLIATKNSGVMKRWDGFQIVDMPPQGPSSPYSVAESGGYFFYLNRNGYQGYGGARAQLLSNAVQRQIYNSQNQGILGSSFGTAPGVVHKYDYLAAVGTITDDFTDRQIANAVHKYDYQKNEFLNYSLAHAPTAFHSFTDADGDQQLIFGNASGQCYRFDPTLFTDAGQPIATEMLYIFHDELPYLEKEFRHLYLFFNPGNEAQVQIATSDSYTRASLNWVDVGDCSDGLTKFNFPPGSRGSILFVRIYESSRSSPFTYYGAVVDYDPIPD